MEFVLAFYARTLLAERSVAPRARPLPAARPAALPAALPRPLPPAALRRRIAGQTCTGATPGSSNASTTPGVNDKRSRRCTSSVKKSIMIVTLVGAAASASIDVSCSPDACEMCCPSPLPHQTPPPAAYRPGANGSCQGLPHHGAFGPPSQAPETCSRTLSFIRTGIRTTRGGEVGWLLDAPLTKKMCNHCAFRLFPVSAWTCLVGLNSFE